jgi:hypothetical protein
MRKYIIIVLMNLSFFYFNYSYGDSHIILKVVVSIEDSQLTGYLWINSYFTLKTDSINNSIYLTKAIKSIPEFNDRLVLYNYVIPVNYNRLAGGSKVVNYLSINHLDSLKTKLIKKVEFQDSLYCYYGTYIPSNLEMDDVSWINSNYVREERFENDNFCEYSVLFYETSIESDNSFKMLLQTYSMQDWEKYNAQLKELRKNKMILIQSCTD